MKKIPQDIVGSIAILKFKKNTFWIIKKWKAMMFLKTHKNVTTVLEKKEKISGRLRKQSTKYLAGIKTKETIYKENNCIFKYNIDEVYFSPRLSNERKLIAEEILRIAKKNQKIIVMFAGIAPYPIIIAKKLKEKGKKVKIYSNELNKKANLYAKENIRLNKLEKFIELLPGDAKKLSQKIKFDIILMPRPNLKETFLKKAIGLSKKGTIIFYHGFGNKEKVLKEIKKDAQDRIGKIEIRKAGDIGKKTYRWNAKFKVI